MKSTFAKIVDSTVGAALVFIASFAVIRYYAPTATAVFGAACVTFTALVLLRFGSNKKSAAFKLSKAADEMFFDFMFLPNAAPARLLAKALATKDVPPPTVRGDAVYVGKTAAFFAFDAPPDEKALARMIARAKHFGAKKAVVFSKGSAAKLQVNDFELTTVCGDKVFELFASLGALPEHKYEKSRKTRRAVLRAALGKDKIARYIFLSAALFFVAWLTHSIVTTVCAAISAALALASTIISLIGVRR